MVIYTRREHGQGRGIVVDTSVFQLYDRVEAEVGELPSFDEMLFYAGSPDAEIVVVSEAPTLPSGPADHTLFHTVTEEMDARSVEEVSGFLRSYPFQDEGRNDLFREYVDRILAFCDRPEEEIGFTDLCKQPLAAFGDGTNLEEVWNESTYSREAVITAQLRMVDPDIVVCNKKNVSRLLSQAFLGADGYSGDGWPVSTWDAVPSEGLTLVYSTMAHMQMSLLSRKRLSEDIRGLHRD